MCVCVFFLGGGGMVRLIIVISANELTKEERDSQCLSMGRLTFESLGIFLISTALNLKLFYRIFGFLPPFVMYSVYKIVAQ